MNSLLVLTTVNAPHRRQLSAKELADCLVHPAAAKSVPGHMSVFFGEVDAPLQLEFASQFGISKSELAASAKAFAAYSGESYPTAA
jgi:hypothetical protein